MTGQPYTGDRRLAFLIVVTWPYQKETHANYLSAEFPEGGLGYVEEYIGATYRGEGMEWHIIETADELEVQS